MHETGLAASVVATVDSYRKKHKGSRVVQFEVGYGELLGLDGKALYDGLSEGLPGTRAVVNRTKTEFRCRRCGASGSGRPSAMGGRGRSTSSGTRPRPGGAARWCWRSGPAACRGW
ncbi:MAG: hydrogenase maturation nickel metallochaperone HypA, partial [Nitrososphaerota archaeon]|nr:hydrogenase maturation nickel metallochaperone HypA [Nitrososphaerota archaeon]